MSVTEPQVPAPQLLSAALESRLSALPSPAPKPVAVRVDHSAAASIRRGSPWIFDTQVTRTSTDGAPGDTAIVYDPKNKLAGVGLFDPDSPIRVRLLQRGPLNVDDTFYAKRIAAADQLRERLRDDPNTTGWRLLHGPNDALPGFVADRYADTVVVKLYSAVWLPRLAPVLRALYATNPWERLVLRVARGPQQAYAEHGLNDGDVLDGPPLDGPVIFTENGIRFEAEPVIGQKTGFFLDQRENRQRVQKLAAGRDVLNVFSYTGGFSLYAARGGARSVTSIDISQPATDACVRNFALNQHDTNIAAAQHTPIAEDAFAAMTALKNAGKRFGVVVIDPPSFAKKAAERERALAAYARLTKLGLDVLAPGGTLVLASCSSRILMDAFRENAERTAAAYGHPLSVFETTGQPVDHPATFDEAGYLKCLFSKESSR